MINPNLAILELVAKARCSGAPIELRAYLSQAFRKLTADADFNTTLAGHLPGDADPWSEVA